MRSIFSRSYVFAFVLTGVLAVSIDAHAALYLKYGNVSGDVTAAGYEHTIELDSFSLGVGRTVSSPTGGATDRETSAPSFSQVSVTALASSASVPMFEAAVQGQAQDATIYVTKAVRGALVTYAEWDFRNTLVTSFSTSSGGEQMIDAYTLDPTSYTYKWTNYDTVGNPIGNLSYTYDLNTRLSTLVSSGDTTGFSFVTSAPEPASMAMLLLAAPAILSRRRA